MLTRQSYIDDQGWFDLCDLTEGQGPFSLLPTPMKDSRSDSGLPTVQEPVDSNDSAADSAADSVADSAAVLSTLSLEPVQSEDGTEIPHDAASTAESGFRTRLRHGVQFQTSRLVWSLTALPRDQVLTIRMFRAARDGCLPDLRSILDTSQCAVCPAPFVFVTPPTSSTHPQQHPRISQYGFSTMSIVTDDGVDVNAEYQPPSLDDSSHLHQRYSATLPPHFSPSSSSSPHPSPRLLLHIAVVNNDLDMVLYLLEKGADVSSITI